MDGLLRRRFSAETHHGTCVHEIQVTYAREKWFSRIVTLPDRVWRNAADSRPVVYQAATREQVEGAAFALLIKECGLRGERLLGLNNSTSASRDGLPARRTVAMCPLDFNQRPGRNVVGPRSIEQTFTANLSETGLFIVTARGLTEGATLDIRLMLSEWTEKLQGRVVWRRRQIERGRPLGLGVELIAPPPSYRSRLTTLRPEAPVRRHTPRQ